MVAKNRLNMRRTDRRTKERRRSDRRWKFLRPLAWAGMCFVVVIGFRITEDTQRRVEHETQVRIYTGCVNGNKRAEQVKLFVLKDLPQIGVQVTPELQAIAEERFKPLPCPPRPAHFKE